MRKFDAVFGPSLRVVALACCASLAIAAPASAEPVVDGEFEVAGLDGNSKLVADGQGNVWVAVADGGKDAARITPAGEVTSFDLGVANTSGVALGPGGLIWMTHDAGVVSFDPADPEGSAASTAITVGTFHSLALGPDGNLWLATNEKLVRIPPADPGAKVEFNVAGLSPRDIDAAGDLLAIADFGGNVVTATTAGATVAYPLAGGSQGVAGGPGGQIAFTQQGAAPTQFGLLSPPAPPSLFDSPGTDPFGVALGPDGAYWVAQFNVDGLTRLTPDGQSSALQGFSAGSGPRQIAAGAGGTLWVTLETANKVGRVSGVEAPPLVAPIGARVPNTRITRGPKGKVRTKRKVRRVAFRFRSIPAKGARFQCSLVKLRKGKRVPKPRFRGCKSPRVYRLKPGRYRFQVRAVLNGAVDPTPAKRAFRIVRARHR